MEYSEKKRIIEALIFASDDPLTTREIISILKSSEEIQLRIKINDDEVLNIIRELNNEYVQARRSFRITQVAGGFQFATMPEFADWLGLLVKEKAKRKLSQSALETLAVIAYKQPVTKPEIEAIRGVAVDYMINTLLEKDLITIVGRAATPGRPLLYGSTHTFLKHFGLNDLIDLPRPREIDEILSDTNFEIEKELLKRMGKNGEVSDEDTNGTDLQEGNIENVNKSEDDNRNVEESENQNNNDNVQ